jgi:hypothetical protein
LPFDQDKGYNITGYSPGDEKEITALFREVFGKEFTVRQWEWKYAVPGHGRIFSRVARDVGGRIIGHAGAVPLKGLMHGRPIPFFQIADVMVHKSARGNLGKKGLFTVLMTNLLENLANEFPDLFSYGFAGPGPFRVGERAGVYGMIDRAPEFSCIARKYVPCFCRAREIGWSDDRVDRLWEKNSRNLALTLIRDREYFRWRYQENPYFRYRIIGIFFFKRMIGWSVIRDDGEEVLVTDIFAEKRNLSSSLKALGSFLTSEGKTSFRFWLPRTWTDHAGPCRIRESEVIVVNMIWELPVRTPFAREHFFYTMSDADIF